MPLSTGRVGDSSALFEALGVIALPLIVPGGADVLIKAAEAALDGVGAIVGAAAAAGACVGTVGDAIRAAGLSTDVRRAVFALTSIFIVVLGVMESSGGTLAAMVLL